MIGHDAPASHRTQHRVVPDRVRGDKGGGIGCVMKCHDSSCSLPSAPAARLDRPVCLSKKDAARNVVIKPPAPASSPPASPAPNRTCTERAPGLLHPLRPPVAPGCLGADRPPKPPVCSYNVPTADVKPFQPPPSGFRLAESSRERGGAVRLPAVLSKAERIARFDEIPE